MGKVRRVGIISSFKKKYDSHEELLTNADGSFPTYVRAWGPVKSP